MNTNLEERRAMGELALKSLFRNTMNVIPIAGPILTDVLFEYRNKVKQDRLFKFIEILKEHFSNENPKVNIDNANSEEFGDLFENVLNKVTKSRSQEKIIGFKNILIRGMKSKEQINDCELFSDLLLSLNETDILVLDKHKEFSYEDGGFLNKRSKLKQELEDIKRTERLFKPGNQVASVGPQIAFTRTETTINEDIREIENKLERYKTQMQANRFSLTKGHYTYTIQNLNNKGLLIDQGIGAIGVKPFELMAITDFGKRFLEFITFS